MDTMAHPGELPNHRAASYRQSEAVNVWRDVGRFLLHFGEMLVAMMVGMGIFNPRINAAINLWHTTSPRVEG